MQRDEFVEIFNDVFCSIVSDADLDDYSNVKQLCIDSFDYICGFFDKLPEDEAKDVAAARLICGGISSAYRLTQED